MSLHTYELTSVPLTCTDYAKGDLVDVYVTDPAPQTIILNLGGDCNGSTGTLQS